MDMRRIGNAFKYMVIAILLAGCNLPDLPGSPTPGSTLPPAPTATLHVLPTGTSIPALTPAEQLAAPDLPDLGLPAGETLVFSGGHGIYRLLQAGGVLAPVVEHAEASYYDSPSFAPGGDRLVFDLKDPHGTHIYTVNPDGSGLSLLLDRIVFGYPAWSPDGEAIAYTTGAGLFVSSPQGKGLRLLAKSASLVFPAWSPNGKQLAVLGNPGDYSNFGNFYGPSEIYVVDSDGQNFHSVSGAVAGAGHLSWSPDAGRIAFRSFDGCGDINVLDLSNGSITDLTNTPDAVEQDPVWSPDGSLIAFSRAAYAPCQQDHVYIYHGTQLYLMKADGSQITALAGAKGDQPSWWPEVTLHADWQYRVTRAGDYLAVRTEPTVTAAARARLRLYTTFTVLAGPKPVDGANWWNIRSADGVAGWSMDVPGQYVFFSTQAGPP